MIKRLFLRFTKKIFREVEQDAKNKIAKELINILEKAGKLGLIPRVSEMKGNTSIGLGIRVYVASGDHKNPISISVGDNAIANHNLFGLWTNLDGYKKLVGGKQ